jgi:hypothetical protein
VYPTRVIEMKPLQQSNQDILVLREQSDKIRCAPPQFLS